MKLIAIHSMPRSGSTWLGSIIDSHPHICYKHQPLFSFCLKGYLDETSDYEKIQKFKSDLIGTNEQFIDQIEKKNRGIIPTFKKGIVKAVAYKETRYHYILENLLKNDQKVILVCLIRNPLAHLFSWFNAPKEFRQDLGWNIREEWFFADKKNRGKKEEYYGYQKWKETSILFHSLLEKFPNRCLIVDYSQLLKNPFKQTTHIFNFINLKIHPQTENFIIESKRRNDNDPYGVYRTKQNDNSWQGELPDCIVDYIYNDLFATELEPYINS